MENIMSLPVVMIENILSYLSFDEIAKNRLVSSSFNEICMKMLNRGFILIERRHAHALKNVKAQLPRRESERRYHQLSRHCDILTSIETRISMLNMTYSKFIDHGLCCFIPGKVIDEIRRVLIIVETENTPPRAHEVLQELRDISSMAIEHFDDKISPAFRKKLQEGTQQPQPRPTQEVAPLVTRTEVIHLRHRAVLSAKLSLYLAAQYKMCTGRILEYKKVALRQFHTIKAMAKRQKVQDAAIAELKRRIEECDIKYSELTHTNQAAGGKVIGASKSSEVTSTQPLRHFSSQIKLDLSELPIGTSRSNTNNPLPNMKPRTPVIKMPSLSEAEGEPPSKIAKMEEATTSSPKNRTQSSTKTRGITKEIRNLTQLSKCIDAKLKRQSLNSEFHTESKKFKKDYSIS